MEEFNNLKNLFKKEVDNRSGEIDPDNEYCWLSLTIGWAVAKGLSPEDAQRFGSYIRYQTDLG